MRGMNHDIVPVLKKEVQNLLSQEERLWRQRAHTGWLKGGDRNTWFFHQQASQRRRRNFISELQDDQGTAHSGDEAVVSLFVDYFTNLI